MGKADGYKRRVIAGNATVQTTGEGLKVRMDNAPGAALVHYERKTKAGSGRK